MRVAFTRISLLLLSIIFSLIFIHPIECKSEVRRICKVAYQTEDGWSKEYTMEVSFATGKELNDATQSFNYSTYSNYCLIWFDQGEVAILKLDAFLIRSGDKFADEDFRNLFSFRKEIECQQINSESERHWNIKAKDFIQFIDPRDN